MTSVCRTCLTPNGEFLDIFCSGPTFASAAEAIMDCASIKISRDDNLSVVICCDCLKKLQSAHQFRIMCIQSDISLRNLVDIKEESRCNTPEYFDDEDDIVLASIKIDLQNEEINDQMNIQKNCMKHTDESAAKNGTLKTIKSLRKKRLNRIIKQNTNKKENVVPKYKINKSENNLVSTKEPVEDTKILNLNETDLELSTKKKKSDGILRPIKQKAKRAQRKSNNMFECELCNKNYHSSHGLRYHMQIHTGLSFECDVCHKRFTTRTTVKRHKAVVHSDGTPIPVRVKPEKRLACQICGNKFRHNCNLIKHMKVHNGERPYMCETCGKTFTNTGNLLQHTRTHTGERRYRCEECGKFFADRCKVRKHARAVHAHERPHECGACGRRFGDRSTLKLHATVHTGERAHVCDLCGRAFARANTLAAHRRTHTGEKPYACVICGRRFTQKTPLNVHMRSHATINTINSETKTNIVSQVPIDSQVV